MTTPNIPDLVATLDKAEATFRAAQSRAASARAAETAALNDLNAAQKALDAALAERRKDAPPNSDWNRTRMLPVEVGR